jgi:hypothetical protein
VTHVSRASHHIFNGVYVIYVYTSMFFIMISNIVEGPWASKNDATLTCDP